MCCLAIRSTQKAKHGRAHQDTCILQSGTQAKGKTGSRAMHTSHRALAVCSGHAKVLVPQQLRAWTCYMAGCVHSALSTTAAGGANGGCCTATSHHSPLATHAAAGTQNCVKRPQQPRRGGHITNMRPLGVAAGDASPHRFLMVGGSAYRPTPLSGSCGESGEPVQRCLEPTIHRTYPGC